MTGAISMSASLNSGGRPRIAVGIATTHWTENWQRANGEPFDIHRHRGRRDVRLRGSVGDFLNRSCAVMARIPNTAPVGSLLDKRSRSKRVRPVALGQRRPREKNAAYLELIRALPCLRCGRSAVQAAHVRMSAAGETPVGIGTKPSDQRSVPLCSWCHLDASDSQHRVGESAFYGELGIDPLALAKKLYAARPDLAAMRIVIHKARRRFA